MHGDYERRAGPSRRRLRVRASPSARRALPGRGCDRIVLRHAHRSQQPGRRRWRRCVLKFLRADAATVTYPCPCRRLSQRSVARGSRPRHAGHRVLDRHRVRRAGRRRSHDDLGGTGVRLARRDAACPARPRPGISRKARRIPASTSSICCRIPDTSPAHVHVRICCPPGAPTREELHRRAAQPRSTSGSIAKSSPINPATAAVRKRRVGGHHSTNDVPIIVERAMYLIAGGQTFGAGHESAGVTAPATRWFLAEGATGRFFDLFILIANPTRRRPSVEATYLLPDGTTRRQALHRCAGKQPVQHLGGSRGSRGSPTPAVSDRRRRPTNGVPIIVERAMWWPGPTPARGPRRTIRRARRRPARDGRWPTARWAARREHRDLHPHRETSAAAGTRKVTLLFEDGDDGASDVPARRQQPLQRRRPATSFRRRPASGSARSSRAAARTRRRSSSSGRCTPTDAGRVLGRRHQRAGDETAVSTTSALSRLEVQRLGVDAVQSRGPRPVLEDVAQVTAAFPARHLRTGHPEAAIGLRSTASSASGSKSSASPSPNRIWCASRTAVPRMPRRRPSHHLSFRSLPVKRPLGPFFPQDLLLRRRQRLAPFHVGLLVLGHVHAPSLWMRRTREW